MGSVCKKEKKETELAPGCVLMADLSGAVHSVLVLLYVFRKKITLQLQCLQKVLTLLEFSHIYSSAIKLNNVFV